jgi:hypothetical protein
MAWNDVANNQTVSFNNLQSAVNNGVFTAKTSIPASNEQITKADANTYVNINTSYGPYAALASNQLVVKSDLQAVITSYAHTVYYYSTCYYDGFYIESGAPTASTACTSNPYSITLYSADFALGSGSLLYYDSNLSSLWYSDELCGGSPGYFKVGDYSFQFYTVAGTTAIQNYTLCSGQTAYSFGNCGVSNSSASGACSDASSNPKTLYSECSLLTAGCSLFYNSNLTNPVTELYTFADSANWDMDAYGVIVGFSSVQC